MTIYFSNAGTLDLDVIRTMGVSVKPGTDTPIGYFGTGLKYAIATLLRTNHSVMLRLGDEEFKFKALPCQIRGETFNVVHMNNEKLAFTTDLGRNWEPWMAFRELYSNALDEPFGYVSDRPPSCDADTLWIVTGDGIREAYYSRHEVFLEGEPSHVHRDLEIFPGSSQYVFYRGVRVLKLPKPSKFTYNFLNGVKLTEDRTASSTWDIFYRLGGTLPQIPDTGFAHKLLRRGSTEFLEDSQINLSFCVEPSDEFLDVACTYMNDARAPKGLKDLVLSKMTVTLDEVELTNVQQATVQEALNILLHLNCRMQQSDFKIVKHLGPGVYGVAENGQIKIAEQTVDNGAPFLAITLWEEYIHRELGYDDCTRGMQQYLFDKILALVMEKHGA